MFGERVRGGSHEALASRRGGERREWGESVESLSVHTTQKGEGGRGDAMRRVSQQRGSKYSRERGAGRERRTGGIFKSKKLEA